MRGHARRPLGTLFFTFRELEPCDGALQRDHILQVDVRRHRRRLPAREQIALSIEQVENSLSDHARFTVFGLIDVLIEGRIERALRVLDGLKREGTEPIVVLITLSREIRNIANVAADVAGGMNQAKAFQKNRVWQSKAQFYAKALRRIDARGWQQVLGQIARADRILKGREARIAGSDAWDEFERLALLICGINAGELRASA